MTDDRHVQENQADSRHMETIEGARDARARVLDGLAALDKELQRVRRAAEALPSGTPPPRARRRFWPWLQM